MTALREQLQTALGDSLTFERELGGGGMSCVFLATEATLGRRVVVKVLPAELAAGVSVERFRREIQVAAQLQHPHIVPLITAGVANGLPFYTMPFIEGETLRAHLARTGELPVSEAVSILRDVVKGIAFAHRHDVVHRDIKPENILLSGGSALVADFGVAKAISESAERGPGVTGGALTSMGVALGTPAYMAPEQAAADPMTDHRADLYALGVVAYEMLTGQAPFSGRPPQAILAAHMTEAPEPIARRRPQVPPALASLIMRALEKRPADRPQSASEFLQVLDALGTPSGGTTPMTTSPMAQGGGAGRRTLHALASVAIVLTLAAVAWMAMRARQPVFVAERVVILPFANKTGDPALASLGPMAADWITRSLSESRVAEVAIAPRTNDDASAGDLTPARIRTLARATGAATIIGGAYYRVGDSVQFTAQLADARRGEVVQSVGPVTARASPVEGMERLRQRLMGLLAARLDTSVTDIADATNQPPTYEAYREYLAGDEAFRASRFTRAAEHFLRATSIDSNFTFPLVRAAYAYQNLAEREESYGLDPVYAARVDSIERALRPRRSRMSAYDVAYLDRVVGWLHGDYNAAYVAGRRLGELAPRSSFARYVAARSAIPVLRFREATVMLDSISQRQENSARDPALFDDLATALHGLDDHQRELELTRRAIARFPQQVGPLVNELKAMAALGQIAEIPARIDRLLSLPPSPSIVPAEAVVTIAGELLWHGHPDAARATARRALAALGAIEDSSAGHALALVRAGILAGELDVARNALAARAPSDHGVLAARGVIAALRGDTTSALSALARLAAMKGPYLRAAAIRGRAQIAAALGRREDAVELLRLAFGTGMGFSSTLHTEPMFARLHDYPPMVALLASRD